MPPPERRDTDTPRAYAALCDYAAMGPGRSIDKLLQFYNSSVTANPPTRQRGTLGLWSGKHDWQARVADYDAAILADEEQQRQAIRAARRAELEEMDWAQGALLRQKVAEIASELPKFIRRTVQRIEQDGKVTEVITLALNAGPGELARALKLASELQRLSVGIATEQIDSNQTIEIRYVDNQSDDEATASGTAHDHA